MTLRREAREGPGGRSPGLGCVQVGACRGTLPGLDGHQPGTFREPLLPSAGRVEVSQCGSAARGDAGNPCSSAFCRFTFV